MRRARLPASASSRSHVVTASGAEIAPNDFGIRANRRGDAFSDFAPEIHDGDALRNPFEQLEMMLDHEDRSRLAGIDDALEQMRRLGFRETRKRLVKQ